MKPVKPSKTRSQRIAGNELCSGIDVVTTAYDNDGKLLHSLITCWELSFVERLKLLFTGRIYVEQLTKNLPPQKLSISREEVNLDKIEAQSLSTWNGAIGAEPIKTTLTPLQ